MGRTVRRSLLEPAVGVEGRTRIRREAVVLVVVIVLALLALFELAAPASGADSRDGDDWRTHPRL